MYFRFANNSDVDTIYNWSNDPIVRASSFNSNKIEYVEHVEWYNSRLQDLSSIFYVFYNENDVAIGLVRIEKKSDETIISIMIDKNQRGKTYASEMLIQASTDFLKNNPNEIISAYIKIDNIASLKSFKNAGFSNEKKIMINEIPSIVVTKSITL